MADASTAKAEQIVAEAQKAVEQNMGETVERMTKGFEGVASFNQDNLDAMMESTRIAAKAAESVNQQMVAYSKRSYEESIAAAKDIAGAKSAVELVEKQASFAKAAMETLFAEASKMNDTLSAATKEASAPLTARLHAGVDFAKSLTA
ncbi:MAG: phasin family protein [Pseudomonadota bacterium]